LFVLPLARAETTEAVLRLERRAPGPIVFGLPLPPGRVKRASAVRLYAGSLVLPARIDELLSDHDAHGAPTTLKAVRVQLPAWTVGERAELTVRFDGPDEAAHGSVVPYRDASSASPEPVEKVTRTVAMQNGRARLVEGPRIRKTLFEGREPNVLVDYPAGYIAQSGILGAQVTLREAHAPGLGALRFFSDALAGFIASTVYDERYPLTDDPDAVPDPKTSYEGWLYDRCATLLLAYTHLGDSRWLRHGLRHCSYYAGQIGRTGDVAGIFLGKPEHDPKYSHLRGLYAYYALTGDEEALAAGRAIAELWLGDELFVKPYREGHVRGEDKLWTERLLAGAMEGLVYGHRLTGEPRFLKAALELLATAHKHVTGSAAALKRINPGAPFPPQNCFIHSAAQQAEGNRDEPWCSTWMSELLVDPLLRLEEQTGDRRVGDIFIRLTRFLRDVGSSYYTDEVKDDRFLKPSVCDQPGDENRRRLVPLYGAGLDASGRRRREAEDSDVRHCADATALTAAAIRALHRTADWSRHPVGPFASEGESFVQLHHELAACAQRTFVEMTRKNRDPANFANDDLSPALADPTKFVRDRKLGWPSHNVSPQRMVSWWFNTALEQFALLRDAGVRIERLQPGRVGPPCR
jgi:hypothetical protein